MRPVQSYTDSTATALPPPPNPIPKRASSTRSRKNTSSTIAAAPSLTEPLLLPETKRSSAAISIRADDALATTPTATATETAQARTQTQTNHHVLALTPTTRSAVKSASNMPPSDKSRSSQLGASAAKPSTRSPLTPKVAVKPPHGHAATPLARSNKEDITTAASPAAYVNSAATARSGPRQSRGNSASTTPSGTPRPDRAGDMLWDNSSRPMAMPPLLRTESHTSSRQAASESSSDQRNDASKFFYASEVKPQPSFSRPGSVQQKAPPTFFYASEAPPSAKRSSNPPANPANPPVLAPTSEGVAAKFFYANGTPELSTSHPRPPLAALPSSGSGSSTSTTSRMIPVRPSTSNSAPGYGSVSHSRPDSPPKGSSANASHSSRSSVIMPASPNRNQVYSTPSIASATTPSRRRVSIDASPKVASGHARTGSVPGMDAFNATKFIMPTVVPSELASSPLAPGPAPVITMASLLQTADELDDEEDEEDDDDDDDDHGDGNSDDDDSNEDGEDDSDEDDSDQDSFGPSKSEPVSDYVLSARRERKVQDLEIRNTSLEAINKTLERQLRKQSAELRRFRRLSRAGKLPTESSVPNSRAASVQPSELSDLSEEESEAVKATREAEEDDEDEDSYSSEESSSTESASGSQSDNSNRRKRDERRLQLDLARHQELLQDSQKMNQSLKRCLNWTEELIKEGQKALAHQVRVSDVQFGYGGRVLSPPDEDDDETSHHADETLTNVDSVDSDTESAADPWVKGTQDRDSGIELPVDSG